jgi:hypothetical protein
MKKVIVNGIPRQAVLKPAHAVYRLQNQRFDIGDRVAMVKDSGSVPLSIKGVVIGINAKTLDVVWDVSFMSGSTLGNRFATHSNCSTWESSTHANSRCSEYRGTTVEFHSCLNLSNPQSVTPTDPSKPQQSHQSGDPHRGTALRPSPQSVWKPPANQGSESSPIATRRAMGLLTLLITLHSPVHIMANPHRNRFMNGRGGGTTILKRDAETSDHRVDVAEESQMPNNNIPNYRGRGGSRGANTRGGIMRGGSTNVLGGRGGYTGGRGVVPPRGGGGHRGRGRGQGALWNGAS